MKIRSLKSKIILLAMSYLLVTAAVVILYSTYVLRGQAVDNAKEQLLAIARAQAANIEAEMTLALDTCRTFGQILSKVKDHDSPLDLQRYEAFDLLEEILTENPRFYGVFTCWDPQAYDYLDAGFANEEGHDASGRLAPYWQRTENGGLKLSPLLTNPYHSHNGQPGSWYESSRQSLHGQVMDPVVVRNNGKKQLIAIVVEPIVHDNQFYGVAGVDLDLSFLQTIADQLKIFDNSGTMSVVSHNGTLGAFSGQPDHIGQPLTQTDNAAGDLPQRLRLGEEIIEIRNGLLHAFTPFTVGQSGRPWAVGIVVPVDKIIAAPLSLMWRQIIIFSTITVVMLIAVFYGARSVTRPLSTLLQGMKKIKDGDFSHKLTVRSHDEIGELAAVFNLMRTKIEETLQELHQHQEKLEEKVLQRTMQLKDKNTELNKANEDLNLAMDTIQEAQEKLLQNEKLAIVGQMSGIVAHEVLNPVSAVSIRIETNIEQARRTLAVIEKMHAIILAAERDFRNPTDSPQDIITHLRDQFPMIVKIGESLKKNQETRLEDLYFLEKQMNRIVRIVDNLRQMSKTQKDIEPVFLNKLVHEVLEDMGDGLRKRKIRVIKELPPVPSIKADHTELYSVVSNLVRNAMQAVEKLASASERIITVHLVHRDDGYLELVVEDNGLGIAPEIRDSVFEPGFTSKGKKGTGLGLSFSRKIARGYHGDLALLDQKPGRGAAFQVLLPMNQESA